MTRAVISLVLLLVSAAACDGGGSAGPPPASRSPKPLGPVHPAPSGRKIPPSATTTPSVAEPPTPEHPPAVRVAPRTLSASWSGYVGRRVSFQCRPIRRIDFTRTLIVANGERFVTVGPPDATPCSARTSTFTVLGSTSVPIAGRTVLPELLLEDDGGEDGAR